MKGVSSDDWEKIKKFVDWCAKDIREIADEFITEIAKKDRDLQFKVSIFLFSISIVLLTNIIILFISIHY